MIWPFEFRLLQGPYATQQRNFEELCALLIRSKHPNWRIVPRESPDWGIDFLAISPRKVLAFQCKFFIDSFGDVQLRQIVKSLRKAVASQSRVGWREYVVCLPRNLTAQVYESLTRIGAESGVKLSVLQANDLWELLSEFPAIQHAFFPIRGRSPIPFDLQAASLVMEQEPGGFRKQSPLSRRLISSLSGLDVRSKGLLLKVAGDLLSSSGEYQEALAYYLEAQHLLNFSLDRTDVHRAISAIHLKTGAHEIAHQFLKHAQAEAPDEMKPAVGIDYAEYLLLQRDYRQAQEEVMNAIELSKQTKQKYELARAYTVRADIAFDAGNWGVARKYYKAALKISQHLGDSHCSAAILSYLGSVLHRQGNLREALDRLAESVKIFEHDGDLVNLAEALTSMGMVLFEMGDWYSSQQCHRRCLQVENLLGNLRGQSICFNNLGLLARVQGNHHEALTYHLNALEISKKLKDTRGIVYANSYLGLVYLLDGNLDSAYDAFNIAKRLAKRIPFPFGIALSYLNMSQLAVKTGKAGLAVTLAQKGYHEIQKVGGAVEKARAQIVLAEAYASKGHLPKAMKHATRSSTEFAEIGAPYERALSLLVLSGIQGQLADLSGSEQSRARAEELLDRLGAKTSLNRLGEPSESKTS